MTRVRSAAQRAPQTTIAATAVARRWAECDADIETFEGRRQAAIARINARYDAKVVPLIAEAKDLVAQLKPWWAANEAELTEGRRKSIELGGAQLGYRMTPPKVAFEHGKDEDAARALQFFGHHELVRSKPAPDKAMIMRALEAAMMEVAPVDDDARVPIELLGFEAQQSEEFFVDRITAGAASTIAR